MSDPTPKTPSETICGTFVRTESDGPSGRLLTEEEMQKFVTTKTPSELEFQDGILDATAEHEPLNVCPTCNGMGEYSVHSGGPDGDEYVGCDNCDSKGYVQDK